MYCYIDFCQILATATRALGLRNYCYVGRLLTITLNRKTAYIWLILQFSQYTNITICAVYMY